LIDVSEVLTVAIIIALMEEVRTSETSVNVYMITRRNIQKDSQLHTRRGETLKSHGFCFITAL
jgi:hypothetical protein